MIVCCWSPKGGVGTSVVAAGTALLLAEAGHEALLVDLAGDQPAVLGLPEPPADAGVAAWSGAGPEVPADALGRLEVAVAPGMSLLPRGAGELAAGRGRALSALLAADGRDVVVDAGVVGPSQGRGADRSPLRWLESLPGASSVLVTRACYLALRRGASCGERPSAVVLVAEGGRALTATDVSSVLGAAVVAELPLDPAIARVVDAGLLASRMPRGLRRSLAPLVELVGLAALPTLLPEDGR